MSPQTVTPDHIHAAREGPKNAAVNAGPGRHLLRKAEKIQCTGVGIAALELFQPPLARDTVITCGNIDQTRFAALTGDNNDT